MAKPVLDKAKELEVEGPVVETLSTGVRALILPVGASLVDDVVAGLEEPVVPTYYNEEKGREEENPGHPDYVAAVKRYEEARARAGMEALIMFGVKLVDDLPEDDHWLKQLQFLAKRNEGFSLDAYDLDDPLDREYLYKRYVAVGTADFLNICRKAGLTSAAVEAAAKSFKSK